MIATVRIGVYHHAVPCWRSIACRTPLLHFHYAVTTGDNSDESAEVGCGGGAAGSSTTQSAVECEDDEFKCANGGNCIVGSWVSANCAAFISWHFRAFQGPVVYAKFSPGPDLRQISVPCAVGEKNLKNPSCTRGCLTVHCGLAGRGSLTQVCDDYDDCGQSPSFEIFLSVFSFTYRLSKEAESWVVVVGL